MGSVGGRRITVVKILIDFWQLWMDFEFENKIITLQQSNLLMVLNGKYTQVAYLTDLSGGKINFELFARETNGDM